MIKVGIIGSELYENKLKIKDIIFKLKQKHGDDIEIVSRGNQNGAEKYVRKYAIELGLKYKEFNPAHTVCNLYSAFSENFYGKPYTPFNYRLRDKIFSKYIDVCFCLFNETEVPKSLTTCINNLEKNKKKFIMMQ